MFRRNYHGGSSSKRGPRLAIREPNPYQPRNAQVQLCEWPSDEFMIEAGFKDELIHLFTTSDSKNSSTINVSSMLLSLRLLFVDSNFQLAMMHLYCLISMTNRIPWIYRISTEFARYLFGVVSMILLNLRLEIFSLV